MIKNKIIAIMTCGVLLTAGVAGSALIAKKSTNHTVIQNHVLLAGPNLNNLAVVINTNVNPLVLYSSPSSNSSIESYISVGEMLNYTATNNPDFYKVTVQETGATGYISASNMQIIQSGLNKAYENTNKNGQVINVTYDVKLMSSPDVHSQILGSYKDNTQMTVLGKQDQWYKVNIGGQIGYMYQSYVGIDNNNTSADAVRITTTPKTSTSSINSPITNYKKVISSGQFNNRAETTVIKPIDLYKSPSTSSQKLLNLAKGSKLIFIYDSSTPKNWALVGTKDGTLGYVPSNNISVLMGGTTQV